MSLVPSDSFCGFVFFRKMCVANRENKTFFVIYHQKHYIICSGRGESKKKTDLSLFVAGICECVYAHQIAEHRIKKTVGWDKKYPQAKLYVRFCGVSCLKNEKKKRPEQQRRREEKMPKKKPIKQKKKKTSTVTEAKG